jgi:hypothetical protein
MMGVVKRLNDLRPEKKFIVMKLSSLPKVGKLFAKFFLTKTPKNSHKHIYKLIY